MKDRSGSDRRITNRRQQYDSLPGWDGVERRHKRDRRKNERRSANHHPDIVETPEALAKKEKQLKRREKDREIKETRKKGRKGKEFGRS